VVGLVTASFLPESFKQDFPECIKDLENMGKNPYFSWFVWKKDGEDDDKEKESKSTQA
jgi:hypothetical protein